MRDRTPLPRDQRPALPAFAPVPRGNPRHDGWTPERQKAFIDALADTGAVSRAAAMVNMSPEGAYYLRRQPQADEFRRAWAAALDYGVARMKDLAFERAVEGTLVPVITGGKLIGWRRIYNDRLLMFCLRHYGEDANGKRTTVNYFSTRATAGAANSSPALAGEGNQPQAGGGVAPASTAHAEASTTTVRTTITGSPKDPLILSLSKGAAALDDFAGVELDDRAQAEIRAILISCAARQRAVEGTAYDEAEPFIAAIQPLRETTVRDEGYRTTRKDWVRDDPAHHIAIHPAHFLEHDPHLSLISTDEYRAGPEELSWQMLDDEAEMSKVEAVCAEVREAIASARRPRRASRHPRTVSRRVRRTWPVPSLPKPVPRHPRESGDPAQQRTPFLANSPRARHPRAGGDPAPSPVIPGLTRRSSSRA